MKSKEVYKRKYLSIYLVKSKDHLFLVVYRQTSTFLYSLSKSGKSDKLLKSTTANTAHEVQI